MIRLSLALGVAATVMAAVCAPVQAQDGGAFAAGLLGGLAVGAIAGGAAAGAPPPPPPGYGYYAPVYGAPPPRCWIEPQQVWTGYAWVIQRVRVCD
jgi:hypothetical protein